MLRSLLLFLIALFSPVQAIADPVDTSAIRLDSRICVMANAEHLSAHAAFAARSSFDCSDDALAKPANHLWLYLDLEDVADVYDDPAIELLLSYHGAITVQVGEQGIAQRYSATELMERLLVPGTVALPLEHLRRDSTKSVLIGIETPWDPVNWATMSLVSLEDAQSRHLISATGYAMLAGLLITPLILVVLVYPVLRYAFLPYHFGMLASALIYALSWSGLLFVGPFNADTISRSVIDHIAISGAFMFACYLTRALCGRQSINAFWYRALPIAGLIPLLITVVSMVLAPRLSHHASTAIHAAAALPLITIVGALTYGAVKGALICRLQLLAWSPMILYVAGRIGAGLGLLPQIEFLQLGLFPSLVTEALLTSGLVGLRIYGLRQERDKALHERALFEDLATTDDLTGALNRRAFIEHFDQVATSGLAETKTLSLFVIDIDHFKYVNDTHGHAAGDAALVELTRRLKAHCRGEDACARFGGEEFALLVATKSVAAADALAERLRIAISDVPFAVIDRLTISIGIVTLDMAQNTAFDRWYRAADAALYAAKALGRNRVQRSLWRPNSVENDSAAEGAAAWVVKTA